MNREHFDKIREHQAQMQESINARLAMAEKIAAEMAREDSPYYFPSGYDNVDELAEVVGPRIKELVDFFGRWNMPETAFLATEDNTVAAAIHFLTQMPDPIRDAFMHSTVHACIVAVMLWEMRDNQFADDLDVDSLLEDVNSFFGDFGKEN